jgi:cell shape-determining protein MreC
MKGYDFISWLENIWFDLVHFEQADVLSLALRLLVLGVALALLWGLAQSFAKTASRGLAPVWRAMTSPVRSLQRHSRARKHRKENRKRQEAWEREQREQEARDRVRQEEQEKKRLNELEEIKKALVID